MTEVDRCEAAFNSCGAHSAGCIDLVDTTYGYHEEGIYRIRYPNETYSLTHHPSRPIYPGCP